MKGQTVAEYIGRQKPPQKAVLLKLRRIIRKTLPEIGEEIMMGVPWFGKRYYLAAFGDHVNMGFSVSGLKAKEKSLFLGKGGLMRHLCFSSVKDIDERRIAKLVKIAQKSKCGCICCLL